MATLERTKAALIRRSGYPIGQPAPCFLRCCGNELDLPGDGDGVKCPSCNTAYSEAGWVIPSYVVVRVVFDDGDSLVTRINTDLEGARRYYLGNVFNLGSVDDNMRQAVSVELAEVC